MMVMVVAVVVRLAGELDMESYEKLRKEIYEPLRQENIFNWDFMYGEEYALATIRLISRDFHQEIQLATKKLGEVFSKVVQVLRVAPDSLLTDLGLPRETWATVRILTDSNIASVIGRFDFAHTSQGLKMLEFNSDTPTSVVEAFYVNQQLADYFSYENPNQGAELHIKKGFQNMQKYYQDHHYKTDSIYFTALDWHKEDKGTALYLLEQSGLKACFVPLDKLRIRRDGLYASASNGGEKRIDLLYRLYPLEHMAKEKDKKGNPIGPYLLKLIAEKKIAIINPPSAFLAQSKAVQALIWNLHEQKEFFTSEEHEVIETYMLPTYLDNVFDGVKSYVRKPFFGREGGGVALFDATGRLLAEDKRSDYVKQSMVYQELADLEKIELTTLKGNFVGKLLWGSFIIGKEPAAILARVDREITGDMAYFLPLGLT